MIVSVDLEAYSPVDLKDAGLYRYAEHPDTDVLCVVFDDTAWVPGQPVPDIVRKATKFRAWNAQFERNIWNAVLVPKYGFPSTSIQDWQCTAAQAYAVASPYALDKAAEFFGLEQRKDAAGKRLMMQLSKPDKRGKRPVPTPEQLKALIAYCKQDVVVEIALAKLLPPLSQPEQRVYEFDQVINARGIYCDLQLAKDAEEFWARYLPTLEQELLSLTGGIAGTQVGQLTAWLQSQGVGVSTLAKGTIKNLLESKLPENVVRVLNLRLEIGSTALKKFAKFPVVACKDSRIRGMFRYHGASTGRWSGNLIQPQNFYRGIIESEELPLAIDLLRSDCTNVIKSLWPKNNMAEFLGSLCRPVLRAAPGKKLVVGDFASVEARGVAWVAGQENLLQQFREGKDAYVYMAADIFNKQTNAVTKMERFLGKTAVLGCGYGIGHVKFRGQLKQQYNIEIDESLAKRCVYGYRNSFPDVVNCWHTVEYGLKSALRKVKYTSPLPKNGGASRGRKWLFMKLPSGRVISYYEPKFDVAGKLQFKGAIIGGGSMIESTYGGKILENYVSGLCRDLLVNAMFNLEAAGYKIVATIHDEIVCEVDDDPKYSAEEFLRIAIQTPEWAEDFPLSGEAFESYFYHK